MSNKSFMPDQSFFDALNENLGIQKRIEQRLEAFETILKPFKELSYSKNAILKSGLEDTILFESGVICLENYDFVQMLYYASTSDQSETSLLNCRVFISNDGVSFFDTPSFVSECGFMLSGNLQDKIGKGYFSFFNEPVPRFIKFIVRTGVGGSINADLNFNFNLRAGRLRK